MQPVGSPSPSSSPSSFLFPLSILLPPPLCSISPGAKIQEDEIRAAEEKFDESKTMAESAMVNFLSSDVSLNGRGGRGERRELSDSQRSITILCVTIAT